jgi:tRNA(Ile)-lysidine synthase
MDRPSPVATLTSAVAEFAARHPADAPGWCVALSGGADSLALTAVAARLRPTTALIVDHRLQPESGRVAEQARSQALDLGCVAARVLGVDVGTDGGPEAAARTARYRALRDAHDGKPVLLAHTLDDQAETVLLGLGRGSGPRSIAGMRPYDPPWCRPLLGLRRDVTAAACAELGLTAWQDPLLEQVLGGGVAEALARTATALREDTDALDSLARDGLDAVVTDDGLSTDGLAALPEAIRRRVIRLWLLAGGARGLTDGQIRGVDALVTGWRGQGGVAVGSSLPAQRLVAGRHAGALTLRAEPVSR